LPGPAVPFSARRSTPARLSSPVRRSPSRRFSLSERVSIPDRRSSPARRPIPDRFSSLPIVTSPVVAETQTDSRNLTYSAGFELSRRRFSSPVFAPNCLFSNVKLPQCSNRDSSFPNYHRLYCLRPGLCLSPGQNREAPACAPGLLPDLQKPMGIADVGSPARVSQRRIRCHRN
jgi:hypothetical protein